jgi:hypothetical protein
MYSFCPWYNYKTNEYEYLTEMPRDRMKEFIPQDVASQNLFDIYTQHEGLSIEDATIKILRLHIS